ncbi:MAG: UDP-diphosphatase [Microgenomates bacterium 39_7]|nr:MAG: UDP-diphosphatase [Microgenomates bacterium 39_7]
MNIWQAMILGFTQGITELLPISSSGHLVILQNWLQIYPTPIIFDLYLHLISIVVIVYYFRHTLLSIDRDLIIKLSIATVPLVLLGFLLRNSIDTLFNSSLVAGVGLLISSLFNFWAAKNFLKENTSQDITNAKAGYIGVFQAVALFPGISRSGSTLFGSSLTRLDKKKAFEFSFLMAILAIFAASAGQLILDGTNNLPQISATHWSAYLLGGLVCFITSLASLKLLKLTLQKTKYHLFGWYCLLMGLLTLALYFA